MCAGSDVDEWLFQKPGVLGPVGLLAFVPLLPCLLRRQAKKPPKATRRTPTTAPTEAPTATPTTSLFPEPWMLELGWDEDAVGVVDAIAVVPVGLVVSRPAFEEDDGVDVLVAAIFSPLIGIPKMVSVSLCTVVLVGAHVSPKSES